MRVPIPVVILLVLAVIGGGWWVNTRKIDFMTPPTAARLQEIRVKVESSIPRADLVDDAISVPIIMKEPEPPPLPVEEPKPVIELGDLTAPITLQSYGEITPQGSARLIELAAALEEKSEPRRALLAWERVLDLTKPDVAQAATAISAIQRLRPTLPDWNLKPETAIAVTLHAGTGKKLAKTLTSTLESVARDLERASAGIVRVKPTVTVAKTNSANKGPVPVALWLTGPDKKSSSTEVLSFTVDSPDLLRHELLKTVFLLIQSHLERATAYTPPPALTDGEDPLDALKFRVTRLCWSEFAAAMHQVQKIPAKP